MGKQTRKNYLLREDMDPEYLSDLIDLENIPHREVLDFVERVDHGYADQMRKGGIKRRIAKIKKTKKANIVGFASRSIRVGQGQYSEVFVEPFHIKNSMMFGPEDHGYELTDGNEPILDDVQVDRATNYLENLRVNLVVEGFLAMCGERRFMYMDGEDLDSSEHIISIDYTFEIPDLTDAGTHPGKVGDIDSADFSFLYEIRRAKAEYRKLAGNDVTFTRVFGSDTTMARIGALAEVSKAFTPLSSSDPDNRASTYEGFMFDGVEFITWHKEYALDEGLSTPLPDGLLIATVETDAKTGTAPMIWHSAENILNRKNALNAHFDGLVTGDEIKEIGVKMYDNGIPAPSRENVLTRWRVYTP